MPCDALRAMYCFATFVFHLHVGSAGRVSKYARPLLLAFDASAVAGLDSGGCATVAACSAIAPVGGTGSSLCDRVAMAGRDLTPCERLRRVGQSYVRVRTSMSTCV